MDRQHRACGGTVAPGRTCSNTKAAPKAKTQSGVREAKARGPHGIYKQEALTTVLNKLSLDRNTHKARLCIDKLTIMSWPEAHRNLGPMFLIC